MLNLLSLGIGLGAITLLSKVNKSNKMFWVFLTSMLIGFAGGSVGKNYNKFTNKKEGIMQIDSMQMSNTSSIAEYSNAMLDDTRIEVKPIGYTKMKSAGQNSLYRDMIPNSEPGSTSNPECDIGIVEPANTS